MSHLLAIDQGTTSSRAIVFTHNFDIAAVAKEEFPQHYPQSGWVEHDPEDLWQSVVRTMRAALHSAATSARNLAGIGITNQRETTLLWDRKTGRPLHRAVVWQDRRTSDHCARLMAEGHEKLVREKTGLLFDPYFTGTKLTWLLDTIPGARERAERGELAAGTVDTFLVWRLTGGRRHVTDATNASRTMLMDIGTGEWDADLCRLLRVPMAMLPEILNSADEFGETDADILGAAVPILSRIRVDGGMTASRWTMQFIADITGSAVDVPKVTETTALGAAYLAGLKAGVAPAPAEFTAQWKLDETYTPKLSGSERDGRYARWRKAVEATLAYGR